MSQIEMDVYFNRALAYLRGNSSSQSSVKFHMEHDCASGSLWQKFPGSMKALQVAIKRIPFYMRMLSSTSSQALLAPIGSNCISRVATLCENSKAAATAT